MWVRRPAAISVKRRIEFVKCTDGSGLWGKASPQGWQASLNLSFPSAIFMVGPLRSSFSAGFLLVVWLMDSSLRVRSAGTRTASGIDPANLKFCFNPYPESMRRSGGALQQGAA
jgi:hypothetical protein